MGKQTDTTGTIFKIKRFSVHDGPGIRTSVFLKGCPLNCIWCHSPEGINPKITIWYNQNICIACGKCVEVCPTSALKLIQDREPFIQIDRNLCNTSGDCVRICPTNAIQFTGSVTTVSEEVIEIEKDQSYYLASGGGVTLTGGEPLYQPDFSIGILEECKRRKIHTALETSLFCDHEVLNRVSEYIDLFIIDMKIFDPVQHEYFTGKPNGIIKQNLIHLAKSGKDILVRIPLIKDVTDTDINKKAIIDFVQGISEKIPIEFIKNNPLAKNNYKKLGIHFLLK